MAGSFSGQFVPGWQWQYQRQNWVRPYRTARFDLLPFMYEWTHSFNTPRLASQDKTRQDKTRQDKNDVKICWRRKRVHYQIKILASVIYNEGSGQKTPRPFISSRGMYTSRAVPLIQLATEGCKDVVDVDVVVEDKQDKQGWNKR